MLFFEFNTELFTILIFLLFTDLNVQPVWHGVEAEHDGGSGDLDRVHGGHDHVPSRVKQKQDQLGGGA